MKTTALLLSSLILAACQVTVPPAEQPVNKPVAPTLEKRSQTGSTNAYLCKDEKTVRVVRTKPKNTKKRVESITLTFNGVTEKLKSTVSETGKAYTSIHWRWLERVDGNSTLTNAVGVILADLCIMQKSETETTK